MLILFVYGVGDYIFLNDVYEKKTWSLVNIIVFGVMIILPYHQLLSIDYLKFEESQIHEKEYNDKYVDFLNDYERANPMTKKEGEMRYVEQLEKKHRINKKEGERRKKRIKEENALRYYNNYNNQVNNLNIPLNDFLADKGQENINFIIVKGEELKEDNNVDSINNLKLNDKEENDVNKNIHLSFHHNSNLNVNQGNSCNILFSNVK